MRLCHCNSEGIINLCVGSPSLDAQLPLSSSFCDIVLVLSVTKKIITVAGQEVRCRRCVALSKSIPPYLPTQKDNLENISTTAVP